MITYLSRSIALVLTMMIFGSNPAGAACQTYYPFLMDMPSAPTSARLNLSLFSQLLFSDAFENNIEKTQCPEREIGSDFECFSAYSFLDGVTFITGYSPVSFDGEIDDLALNIDVFGVPAKLAPIPTPSGMVNLGYRSPSINGEVVLLVTMPPDLKEHYSTIAPIYPLLMRVFEAEVCSDE